MRPLCAFDLDHTLVRSPLDLARLKIEIRGLVESEGVPLPEAARAWTIGQLIAAATTHREVLGRTCWTLCEQHEEEALLHAQPEPGAEDTLVELRDAGYPLAVWTNNTGKIAWRALQKCGLDRFFSVLVSRDEAALKPDPEGLRVLEARFPERRIWVVGDSWVDGAAAHAGGAAFIAYGADPAELARRGVAPRAVLRDLRQLPGWLRAAAW
jgi:phosphoglycolate phosphatase-like HAD superfamily hydrolase